MMVFHFFQEAGIPIDMVGGVSIGAFMGALWCAEKNVTTMTQKAREWSKVCSVSFCLCVALLLNLKKADILYFLLTYFGITLIFIH